MDSEQRAGEPTVLTAKPNPQWPTFLLVFQAWAPFALLAILLWGVSGLVTLTGVMAALLAFILVLAQFYPPTELCFDEEGVVLRPSRRGFFTPKAISFRWGEVAAVRRGRIPSRRDLKVRLIHVRRFWTFRSQPAVSLTIPPGLWRDERFREALRRHVSAEKIAAGVLDEGRATRRRALLAGGILLACAAAVALCCTFFLAVPGFSVLTLLWLLSVWLLLGYSVWWLGFDGPPGAAMVVGGAFLAALFLFFVSLVFCLLSVTGTGSTLLGVQSAVAGLLLGAAVLTFLGRRARWLHVGLFYLLGVVGWGVGVLAWDGVPSVLVGEVTTSTPTAQWTVTGDGFVLEQSAGEGVLLQWYSADGTPERSLPLPLSLLGRPVRWVQAVGRDAALYWVRGEKESELFVVPRHVGGYRLIATTTQVWYVRVSPDGRHCAFSTETEEGEPRVLCDLELPDGEVHQAPLPPGQEKAEIVGILNDGRLVLITGQRPRDLGGRVMWCGSELPQGDSWKPTYEPVKVWLWDPHGDEAPRLLHAEEEMSLDWELSTTSSPLYLCRVVGDGPRRKEFVEVRLDSDPPEVRPCPPRKLDWRPDPASADGRFVVETHGKFLSERTCVRDTVTGGSRRLRDQPGWFGTRALWSPAGHKFLYTTERVPFTFAVPSSLSVENIQWVARFVDLDR
jgi:hypothetical protein